MTTYADVLDARELLLFWLDALTPSVIRASETPLPAVLDDGSRLRGIELTPRLFLARSRKLYRAEAGGDIVEIFADEVLLLPVSEMIDVLRRLEEATERGLPLRAKRQGARRVFASVRRS